MEKTKSVLDLKGMLTPKTGIHVQVEEMRMGKVVETRLDEPEVHIARQLNAPDDSFNLKANFRVVKILAATSLVLALLIAYKEFFG